MAREVIRDNKIVKVERPSILKIAGAITVIVGILGLAASLFIIFSPIIFGWLIMALIGFFALISGAAILAGADWGRDTAIMTCILSLFAAAIEILGSFNSYLRIVGVSTAWGGIGIATLIASAAALYFLYRPDVVEWYTYETLVQQ